MKFVLLLVSAIAALNLDSPNLSNGHQALDSTNQLQELEETTADGGSDGTSASSELNQQDSVIVTNQLQELERISVDDGSDDDSASSELNEQKSMITTGLQMPFVEERKGHDESELRDTVNIYMPGGEENSTLFRKIDACETAIKFDVNEGNINVTRDIHSLELTLTNQMDYKINNLSNNIDYIMENLTKQLDHMLVNLNKLINNKECQVGAGFIFVPGSHQCLKIFNDTKRTWFAANSKCQSEGLVLARTEDPVSLRSFLVTTHGITTNTWIGAKSDGSYMRWQKDNEIIPSSSSYWNVYRESSDRCLLLLTYTYWLTNKPTKPYHAETCADATNHWALCESL